MKQIKDETVPKLIEVLDECRRTLDELLRLPSPSRDKRIQRIAEIDALIAELENADPVPNCYVECCPWVFDTARHVWKAACGHVYKPIAKGIPPSLCQCNLPVLWDYRSAKVEDVAQGGIVLDPDIVDERVTEIDARIAEIENADPVPECVYLSREEVTLIVDEVIPAAIDGHGQYGYSDSDEVRACKQLEESLRARASGRREK